MSAEVQGGGGGPRSAPQLLGSAPNKDGRFLDMSRTDVGSGGYVDGHPPGDAGLGPFVASCLNIHNS